MSYNIRLILICCFTLFTTYNLEAITLHSILIGNTNDASIGDTVKIDIQKMTEKSYEIAKYSDMELNQVLIVGEDFERSIILDKLQSINFEKDDAVLLYYSGHGYRTDHKTDNQWPNLAMHSEWAGINQYFLTEIIINQNPRFILSIADACNNVIPEPYAPITVRGIFFRTSDKTIKENYKKLFKETNAYIIASGASPGEYSYCDFSKGGHFTYNVLKSLEIETLKQEEPADWDTILTRAKNNLWRQQKPQFEIIYPENCPNKLLTNKY